MSEANKQENQIFSESAQRAIPWMIISKSLLFIIYFSISVIAVRYLGAEQYGIFVICRSIADVLILVCTLGMTASFIRFIPELVLEKNLAGIKRLIGKAFVLQVLALGTAGVGLYLSQQHIEEHFSVAFNGALVFTFVLMVCEQFKTNINSILTALYQTKRLAIFSLFNGIVWLLALFVLVENEASVDAVLSAQSISYALIYLIAGVILFRYLSGLGWRSPAKAIGYKRVLNHSGSLALSTIVRLLMLKYTELFFLGAMTDAETVGMYDLAFSLPMMVIVFIPAALHELFVSGFSEAYLRKNDCLPVLIRALYKTLIMITIPIAVFGFMFAGDLLIYCYGEEVRGVYELTMAFCLLHILPLISTPLSVAIQVREKVMNMFPTLMLQLSVNIVLDYLLIVVCDMGIWGAFLALLLTFILTIPFRLYMVKRILGGIYFPLGFFLRVLFATLLVAYLIRLAFSPENIFSIGFFFPIFMVAVAYVLHILKLIKPDDIQDIDLFLSGKIKKLVQKFSSLLNVKPLNKCSVQNKRVTE